MVVNKILEDDKQIKKERRQMEIDEINFKIRIITNRCIETHPRSRFRFSE